MSEERPITAEQAKLAVKAAGLDPDKPISEQLKGGPNAALERKLAELSEQVQTLTETLGVQLDQIDPASQPRSFAEDYRDALNRSRTPWMGDSDAA
jgi:hypothetical protein